MGIICLPLKVSTKVKEDEIILYHTMPGIAAPIFVLFFLVLGYICMTGELCWKEGSRNLGKLKENSLNL